MQEIKQTDSEFWGQMTIDHKEIFFPENKNVPFGVRINFDNGGTFYKISLFRQSDMKEIESYDIDTSEYTEKRGYCGAGDPEPDDEYLNFHIIWDNEDEMADSDEEVEYDEEDMELFVRLETDGNQGIQKDRLEDIQIVINLRDTNGDNHQVGSFIDLQDFLEDKPEIKSTMEEENDISESSSITPK